MSVMRFDPKTLMVVKNYSSFNPSILFKTGNVLTTMAISKSVLTRAKLDQSFEQEFAIYDLSRFLSVMSLFESPEMEFKHDSVTIRSNNTELEYRFADPSTILTPKVPELVLPSVDVSFTLNTKDFTDIQKALGALSMPEIAVIGDRNTVWLQVVNTKNPTSDFYRINMNVPTKNKFRFVFKAENIKMIPQDYEVNISKGGIAYFKGSNVVDIEYWIVMESETSTFEK